MRCPVACACARHSSFALPRWGADSAAHREAQDAVGSGRQRFFVGFQKLARRGRGRRRQFVFPIDPFKQNGIVDVDAGQERLLAELHGDGHLLDVVTGSQVFRQTGVGVGNKRDLRHGETP
jgi:hypothetical protein